jgi:hypothetical protein
MGSPPDACQIGDQVMIDLVCFCADGSMLSACLPARRRRRRHEVMLHCRWRLGLGDRGTSLSMNLLGWIEYQEQMVSTRFFSILLFLLEAA